MSRIRFILTVIALDLAFYLIFWCWYIALSR